MLDSKGFDLWADGYDESVRISEASDRYPFAGYKKVLGTIYERIRQQDGRKILEYYPKNCMMMAMTCGALIFPVK